jgi:hypothetical protein
MPSNATAKQHQKPKSDLGPAPALDCAVRNCSWALNCDAGCLLRQPLAVGCGEGVVSEEASFKAGDVGGPVAKVAGRGRDGDPELGARVAQTGVVWGYLGVDDLAVDFPPSL